MQTVDQRPGTPDYFIALAQEATQYAEETFGILFLDRGGRSLLLSTDQVGRTTYYVLQVADPTEGILAYSYTSSQQELGMDVDEFMQDYFRDDEDEGECE